MIDTVLNVLFLFVAATIFFYKCFQAVHRATGGGIPNDRSTSSELSIPLDERNADEEAARDTQRIVALSSTFAVVDEDSSPPPPPRRVVLFRERGLTG